MPNDTTNECLEQQTLRVFDVNITLNYHDDEEEPASMSIYNTGEREEEQKFSVSALNITQTD